MSDNNVKTVRCDIQGTNHDVAKIRHMNRSKAQLSEIGDLRF
jgi:hypothetical protein